MSKDNNNKPLYQSTQDLKKSAPEAVAGKKNCCKKGCDSSCKNNSAACCQECKKGCNCCR